MSTNQESRQAIEASQGSQPAMELWRMADLVTPMAVRVAATFSIADHIVAGRVTAAEIADAAGLHAGALNRVLRHLVTVGLLSRDGYEYKLTARGAALRSDHPSGQRALIDLEGAIGHADLSFIELAHVVRTGEPAYPVRYSTTFWEDLANTPALAESFDAIMAGNVGRDAADIARAYDWSSLSHLIDLGGGSGVLMTALLKAHLTLRGTVLDLPRTVERARKTFQDNGLTDRAEVLAGSFFEALPPGADGYLLSSVLHDWDDDAVVTILRRCAEATGERGKVFIIEETGGDGDSPDTAMDVRHLAYYAGQERGLTDNIELARTAGLAVVDVHSARGRVATRSVIELEAA